MSALSSMATASYSPISPSTTLGSGLLPQSDPPASDYMGNEIFFILPSLHEFENWKLSVERKLVVDFVKGTLRRLSARSLVADV